jgi:membrane associated rhomboid family serine protease
MNSDFIPLWEKEDAFPEKPTDQEYGYILRGKFVGCSREELIRRCGSQELPQIHLIWCAGSPRVVPPTQVDFLSDALLQRERGELRTAIVIGSISMLVWGVFPLLLGGLNHTHAWAWMLLLVTATGVIPVVVGVYRLAKLKRNFEPAANERKAIGRYSAWVLTRRILFTWLLLGGITVVFALECVRGFPESAKAAGLDKHAVWRGEWWRLFTGPLLHGNVMHFIFNASALIGLGRLMEVLTSRYYLALIFGVSALSGSIFSLFLLPNTTSVGASGGLLGLIGFLAVLGIKQKQILPPGFAKSVGINVAIIAAMGILAYSIIDNAAHLGGFIAGIAMGIIFVHSDKRSLPLETEINVRIAGITALIVTVGFAVLAAFRILTI